LPGLCYIIVFAQVTLILTDHFQPARKRFACKIKRRQAKRLRLTFFPARFLFEGKRRKTKKSPDVETSGLSGYNGSD
jgi:hypothetical protein